MARAGAALRRRLLRFGGDRRVCGLAATGLCDRAASGASFTGLSAPFSAAGAPCVSAPSADGGFRRRRHAPPRRLASRRRRRRSASRASTGPVQPGFGPTKIGSGSKWTGSIASSSVDLRRRLQRRRSRARRRPERRRVAAARRVPPRRRATAARLRREQMSPRMSGALRSRRIRQAFQRRRRRPIWRSRDRTVAPPPWVRSRGEGEPSTTTISRRPSWVALATTLKPAGQVKPVFIPSAPG